MPAHRKRTASTHGVFRLIREMCVLCLCKDVCCAFDYLVIPVGVCCGSFPAKIQKRNFMPFSEHTCGTSLFGLSIAGMLQVTMVFWDVKHSAAF